MRGRVKKKEGTSLRQRMIRLSRAEKVVLVLAVCLILLGLGLILAPRFTSRSQEKVIAQGLFQFESFTGGIAETTPAHPPAETGPEATPAETQPNIDPIILYPELYSAMEAYNAYLVSGGQNTMYKQVDAFSATQIDLSQYGITETEVVGVVSVPSIGVEMPLYLGATSEHMAAGFAQLSYTSMPIGGESTNCVVAGHRGWRGAKYLLDADKIALGDMVFLQNYWCTLSYRVVEIREVKRYELEAIEIQEDKDLLTLMTCTPVGVGSHRLLIICERVE